MCTRHCCSTSRLLFMPTAALLGGWQWVGGVRRARSASTARRGGWRLQPALRNTGARKALWRECRVCAWCDTSVTRRPPCTGWSAPAGVMRSVESLAECACGPPVVVMCHREQWNKPGQCRWPGLFCRRMHGLSCMGYHTCGVVWAARRACLVGSPAIPHQTASRDCLSGSPPVARA